MEQRAQPPGVSRRAFLKGGALAGGAATLLPGVSAEAAAVDSTNLTEPVGPGAVEIVLSVNGRDHQLAVEPRTTLLDALRDRLSVTGPKKVCDRATCGACTVIEGDRLTYACTRLAIEAQGVAITTAEGLGTPESMHPVQRAFVEADAQQCGYCTPGFVTATAYLLARNPRPADAELAQALGGNLCRCGTYAGILRVVRGKGGA